MRDRDKKNVVVLGNLDRCKSRVVEIEREWSTEGMEVEIEEKEGKK